MADRSPEYVRGLFRADRSGASPAELERMGFTRKRRRGDETADKIGWAATARESRLPGADLLRRYPQAPSEAGPTTEQEAVMAAATSRLRAREAEVPWSDWAGYQRFVASGGA